MGILDFKYKKIPNFFTDSELIILKDYCKKRHENNFDNFEKSELGDTLDTFFYKDPLMQVFLDQKKEIVENETKIKLFSTYSYWRMYTLYAGDNPTISPVPATTELTDTLADCPVTP